MIERAFEPFFTTKPSGSGTGLGLSMVYGFVKQSGGHIKIYSEAGEGTAIKLYLPRLMDENQVEPWIRPSPPPNGKSGADDRPDQILLVEDDEEVNRFSSEVLREEGYHVISTHDAAAGLRLLDANPDIKLLFTDVVLPGGMNGRQLADEALRRRPNLRVLFTTGYTRNAIIHHGRLDADVDLLTKPFTSDALAKKVRQILDLDAKDPITRVSAIIDSIKDKPADDSGQLSGAQPAGGRRLFRQRDRFLQHVNVADVIGEDQHQLRIERRGLVQRQPSPRLDQRNEGRIRIPELRSNDQRHVSSSRLEPLEAG